MSVLNVLVFETKTQLLDWSITDQILDKTEYQIDQSISINKLQSNQLINQYIWYLIAELHKTGLEKGNNILNCNFVKRSPLKI